MHGYPSANRNLGATAESSSSSCPARTVITWDVCASPVSPPQQKELQRTRGGFATCTPSPAATRPLTCTLADWHSDSAETNRFIFGEEVASGGT